jgi:hypothetical protein
MALCLALTAPCVLRAVDGSVALQADTDEAVVFRRRVSEYVQAFYARAQRVVSLERVVLQPLDYSLQPQGRARRLEYELRVEWQPQAGGTPTDAVVHRQLLKVDGRAPRPGDEPGCTDPRALSPEPLAILLPAHQEEYVFSWGRSRRIDGRVARALDYRAAASGVPPSITWRDECVTVEAPGKMAGRVWVDVESGVVLRLEERLLGRIEIPVPLSQQRVASVRAMSVERADTAIRYTLVRFTDPPEEMMLPASIESVTVIRDAGIPRLRTTQSFSNYRRFVTGTRIVN